MQILGIAGSSRKEGVSGVHQLVKTVLENTGCDYELVSLRGKKIGGCIADKWCSSMCETWTTMATKSKF